MLLFRRSFQTGVTFSKRNCSSFAFDVNTKITKIDNDSLKSKGFITNKYSIGDAPNGGYLMAMGISAIRQSIPFRDPLSITAHYISKTLENIDADFEVKILNIGKSTSTAEVSIIQENKLKCKFIGIFGTINKFKGLTHMNCEAPQLPKVEECIDASKQIRKSFGDKLNIAQEFDMYLPKDDHFLNSSLKAKKGNIAALNGWIKFADNRPLCLRSLSFFCDALPPASLNLHASGWIPTMEYTVHFWGRPIENTKYFRAKLYSNIIQNGNLEEICEIWSEDGSLLLAKSRQLARIISQEILK
jgi:acyl-CoA thioesterase